MNKTHSLLIFVLLFLSTASVIAQISVEITGQTTGTVGSTQQFNLTWYDGSNFITPPTGTYNWNVLIGEVTYQDDTYALVNWISAGTAYLEFSMTTWDNYYYDYHEITVTGPPYTPEATSATSVLSTSFTANWNSVFGATGYQLDVSAASDFSSFVSGYQNLPVSNTSQSISGLTPATTYYYRVRAVNSYGTSVNSNTITSFAIPQLSPATALTTNSFTVNWNSVVGANGYRLDVSKDNFSTFLSGYQNLPVTGTSQVVPGLTLDTEYFYRVRAANSGGAISSNSSTQNIRTKVLNHSENFVRTVAVLADGYTSESQLESGPMSDKVINYQFLDRLGRPSQSIAVQQSPTQKDIVQAVTYDALGRQAFGYLPFTANQSNGVFVSNPIGTTPANYTSSPQYLFYNDLVTDPTQKTPDDTKPYAQTVFEKSPLSRVEEQGSVGNAWQPVPNSTTGKTVKLSYSYNVPNEVFKWDITEQPNLTFTLTRYYYFVEGNLTVTITTSEEGIQSKEYKDLEGRTRMVKTQVDATNWIETHYVYDKRGNLRFILPPESIKLVYQQSMMTLSSTFLAKYAYQYAVDSFNRKIAEKVPESEWTYMVYDRLDRLVLSQDPNQRLTNEWTFSKYDTWSRPILTGTTVITGTVESIRTAVESHSVLFESKGSVVHGYTNNAYPIVADANAYLVVSYYDDYCFKSMMPNTLSVFNNASCTDIMAPPGQGLIPYGPMDYYGGGISGLPAHEFKRVQGMPTGGKVRIFGTTPTWLWAVTYYDQNQRAIQSTAQNQLGGYDRASTSFDFAGRMLAGRVMHFSTITAQPQYTITEEYQYDPAGRLKRKFHQIGSDPAKKVRLFELEYNELGQVVGKQLHNAALPVQQIDFRQNIKGWPVSQSSEDFKLQFGFNNSLGFTANSRSNGDLTSVAWINNLRYSVNVNNKQQGWSLNYDNLSRLTGSNYWERNEGAGSWGSSQTKLTESGITYDWNGNIKTLTRKDANNSNLDLLTYNYGAVGQEGNQLRFVSDGGQVDKGFKDGNTVGNDYTYDGAGNLIQDLNKGINAIQYNRLNLTERITLNTGAYLKYIYSAAGNKLAEELYSTGGSLVKRIDYVGPFVYENNQIQFIMHDEGRALPVDATTWEYQYTLRDHLGSARMMVSASPRLLEYKATMETENAATEEQEFLNLPGSRVTNSTANVTVGGNEVSRLRNDMPVGPSISLQVMPGDALFATAFAYHEGTGFGTTAITNGAMITAIAAAFGGVSGAPGEAGQVFNAVNNAYPIHGPTASPSNNHPAAFVNYILFDLNMVPITGGYTRVGTSPGQVQLGPVLVEQPGYVYFFLSNEGNSTTPVYFDDFTVQVQESKLMGAYLTYPFGAEVESQTLERWRMPENRYRFQSKAIQKDLGVELYDFGSRLYDPYTGRWFAVDPQKQFASPYTAMGNNPLMMVDPDGELVWFVPIIIGAVIGGATGGVYAANSGDYSILGGIWRGALIGGIAGAGGVGVSTAGGGAMLAGATGGALGGAGFSGLQNDWDANEMLRGGLIGAASGFVGGGFASAIGGGGGAFVGGATADMTGQLLTTGDLNIGQSLVAGGVSLGMHHGMSKLSYETGGKKLGKIDLTYKEFKTIQAENQRSRFWHRERGVTLLKNADPRVVPKKGLYEGKIKQLRFKESIDFPSADDLGIDLSEIKAQWHSHWSKSFAVGFSGTDLGNPHNQIVTNRHNSYVNYNYYDYRPQDNFFAQYTTWEQYPVADGFARYFWFSIFRF
ncbi:MAG: fibronectin type III domain-containing protein [Cytophagales bacterium]|nr:fibronectin type III domain-containing protein [Cytophagales bacterium]